MTNTLVSRLVGVFGMPESPDPEAVIEELTRMLGVREPLLKDAGDKIMRTYKGRSFPPIGTIMAMFDETVAMANIGKVPNTNDWRRLMPPVPTAGYDAATEERWRKAAEWQKEMADKHGSFDAYLTATAHLRPDETGKGAKMVSKRSSFKTLSPVTVRMTGGDA